VVSEEAGTVSGIMRFPQPMTLVEARACRRIIVDPTRPGTTIRSRVTAPGRVS
jgi:hypothetical protein